MANKNFNPGLNYAKELDQKDPLRAFRERFYQLEGGKIYMDGNSLGLASKDAEKALLDMIEVWKTEGILLWNVKDGYYFQYARELGNRLAKLIKADENEVIVTGNTTINVHQMIGTFWRPTKDRYKILVDDLNFPTDRYAIDSQVELKGMKVEDVVKVVKSRDGIFIYEDDIIEAMTDDVAVILLPSVLYRSAQLVDMERVTKEAHKRGIYIGWDLCHSIGCVEHDFKKIDPDFAIWCNYKYLSAGPGASAGLFVNKKHFGKSVGLAGWFGNKDETQFQLRHKFEQAPDAIAWQTGTPSHFSMAPLEGVLNIYDEAGLHNIREKSLNLTAYLMYLIDTTLTQYGYSYNNPTDDTKRGGHVSLVHDEAYRICLALKDHDVVPDYREPNVIRLAPIALYNSYEDAFKLVEALRVIGENKEWEKYSAERAMVM
ncbi:kynureninase [Dysgonomonas massiliensis]|uniref:kynureninase n=1 Tax=Dysgonomonas massiliensis TaxID=2040292 RepID=UPI000C760521|nr:kynureninase [Dysgonomonas massiliensis]